LFFQATRLAIKVLFIYSSM